MPREITSKVYDENILRGGLQAQIDNYYRPQDISQKRRVEIVLKALSPKPGERILDMGCGVGTFAFHAAERKACSFGLDYSFESIKMAIELADEFNTAKNSNFLVGNVTLPFRNSCFDKVVVADFIEHITLEDKDKLLSEVYRVLKPQGLAIIFTPNGIREKVSDFYWRLRHKIFNDKIPKTELHFGLTTRAEFEPLIKKYNFDFNLIYKDTTRPYLAKIPLVRNFLSLNLLWIVKKL